MNKKRWMVTLFIVVLGIAIVGIANASTIKNASLFGDQNAASPSGTPVQGVTITAGAQDLNPDERVGTLLEACWKLNKAGIEPFLQKAGIAHRDIQEAEKLWAQEILRQNPSLSVQEMAPMHQAWAMGYMQQYQARVTANSVSKAAATTNAVIEAVAPAQAGTPPAQQPAPAPSQKSYQSAPAGHGYHPGHTGQYCTQWQGTSSTYMGHHGGMGGHE